MNSYQIMPTDFAWLAKQADTALMAFNNTIEATRINDGEQIAYCLISLIGKEGENSEIMYFATQEGYDRLQA